MTVVCARAGECVSGSPDAVNLPTFWHIDPAGKVAKSRRPDGEQRSSDIRTVSLEGGTLVLQGSDGNPGTPYVTSMLDLSPGMLARGAGALRAGELRMVSPEPAEPVQCSPPAGSSRWSEASTSAVDQPKMTMPTEACIAPSRRQPTSSVTSP